MPNRKPLLVQAILSVVLLQVFAVAAPAGEMDFHSLVERMSDYYQKRPMRFVGWLNVFANRLTPGGASHFQMAIFDDVDGARTRPGEDFESSLASLVGSSYHTFLNVHDVRSGEWTCIYTRESGKQQIEMLIISIGSNEAVLMKMQLRPEALREWVFNPMEKGRDARQGAQDAQRSQP